MRASNKVYHQFRALCSAPSRTGSVQQCGLGHGRSHISIISMGMEYNIDGQYYSTPYTTCVICKLPVYCICMLYTVYGVL